MEGRSLLVCFVGKCAFMALGLQEKDSAEHKVLRLYQSWDCKLVYSLCLYPFIRYILVTATWLCYPFITVTLLSIHTLLYFGLSNRSWVFSLLSGEENLEEHEVQMRFRIYIL